MRSFLSKHRHFRFSIIKQCGLPKFCVLALFETSLVGGRSRCFITARCSRSPVSKFSLHWHMRWGKGWNSSSSSVLHWYCVYVCVGKRGTLLLLPNGRKCLRFSLGLSWQHSRERGEDASLPPGGSESPCSHTVSTDILAWGGGANYFMAGRNVLACPLAFPDTILVSPVAFSSTTIPSPVGLC